MGRTVGRCRCVLLAASLSLGANASGQVNSESFADEAPIRLRITPYAWLTGFEGNVATAGIGFDIDATFGDIAEASDSIVAYMGAIDLQLGRWLFQIDSAFAQAVGTTERGFASNSGGLVVQADIDSDLRTAWFEFSAGYRVAESSVSGLGRVTLDAFGGLRHTHVGLDVDVTSSVTLTLPSGQTLVAGSRSEISASEDWIEPFVGVRASAALGDRWRLSLRGDVGGFDIDGSSFAWQLVPALEYQWSHERWRLSLLVGYRALGQDYQGEDLVWNVVTHGPLLGFSMQYDF